MKLEAGHVEQIGKLEVQASQQRTMLQEVLGHLEAVNDEVCALRALVADPSSPSGHRLSRDRSQLREPLLLLLLLRRRIMRMSTSC